MVLSTRICMCGKDNMSKLILNARTRAKKVLSGYSREYITVPFSVHVHKHVTTYLASFLCLHYVQLASLYYHASLGCWYNKRSSFLEKRRWLFGLQVIKHSTLTNNSELILPNSYWYFLTFQPTDWTNSKRLMEIQSPMKNPFSAPNPFSTPGQTVSLIVVHFSPVT